MSRIVFRGPTKGYTMSDLDIEWLARSMWGEASDKPGRIAVAWAHMMRFLLINFKWLQQGWPFYRYVQGHSQPINPLWARDGKFCLPGGKGYGTKWCSEALLKRRDKFQKQPVPESIMRLAIEFSEGKHPNPFPVQVYDFIADDYASARARKYGITVSGNTFYTKESLPDDDQRAVVPGQVTIDMPAGEVAGYGVKFILALLLGYGLYRGAEYLYDKVFKKK